MTVTCSHTPAGYDAVAFLDDGTRRHLIDEIYDPRGFFGAVSWIVEVATFGSIEDVGDVLGRMYLGETFKDIGSGSPGEIARLISALKEFRQP